MITVSVIMPVYNVEKYVQEAMQSIINQTLADIEIICIDDGSTDGSFELLKGFEQCSRPVKIIQNQHMGASAARNIGIKEARGQYIYFMDSDDVLDLQALEILYQKCIKDQLDVLFFSGKTFWENAELAERYAGFGNDNYLRKGSYSDIVSGKELLATLVESNDYLVSPCLQILRREFLMEANVGYPHGIIHEDNCFTFHALMKAKRAYCIGDILFHRRIRYGSIMTTRETHLNLYGYYSCFLQQIMLASDETLTDRQREAVCQILNGMNQNMIRIYLDLPEEEMNNFYALCDLRQRLLFDTLVLREIDENKKRNRAEDELNKAKKRIAAAEQKYKKIEGSRSFKIGKKVTAMPRFIKKKLIASTRDS